MTDTPMATVARVRSDMPHWMERPLTWLEVDAGTARQGSIRPYNPRTMAGRTSRLALGVALLFLGATSTGVSTSDGQIAATDWPSTNYDQTANRYSPLKQITAANVRTLQRVWSVHLAPAGFVGRMREDEAIPIVIGNTMYLASPYGAVIALDATTGAAKWRFELPNNDTPSKRGLAYWPGTSRGTPRPPPSIVFGTATGGMYSLNSADGKPNEWFGENGVTNLKTPEVMQTGMDAPYSLL